MSAQEAMPTLALCCPFEIMCCVPQERFARISVFWVFFSYKINLLLTKHGRERWLDIGLVLFLKPWTSTPSGPIA